METELPKVILEKRKNKMFVTRNTEYHVRDDVCVAVKKLDSGDWLMHSKALGARLIATLSVTPKRTKGICSVFWPEVGDHLVMYNTMGEDIITTRIRKIKRPPPHCLRYYCQVA